MLRMLRADPELNALINCPDTAITMLARKCDMLSASCVALPEACTSTTCCHGFTEKNVLPAALRCSCVRSNRRCCQVCATDVFR
jgi:hypothetical protein